ncbi:MAG TPA: guanylate cyclase [Desulfobacteraceae bacterium]|nr:guanylate cyclase [Desulfobacteraceae bacterium]
MKCTNCQSDNRGGIKFCEECGTCIAVECPACNTRIPLGKKFCGECGSRLQGSAEEAPGKSIDYNRPDSYTPKFMAEKILTTRSSIEGERKLVTVFFCDVTGFTSLSEALDPEAVHQIMDGCFKILMEEIHRYEGTINQFTGDGVMALFGAPLAHEDHAQRACSAALAVQAALVDYSRQVENEFGVAFKMRIGLNSGPVVVGAIGDDLRMDYTAVGDTTNLAARMESLAEPGTVQLSESTYRQVRTYFNCKDLGNVQVKGKKDPQPVFRLMEKSKVTSRLQASEAKGFVDYIGREQEMAALVKSFGRVRQGRGQVVGVVGEAGIGKSRFVFETQKGFDPDIRILETRCLQYNANIPFVPVLDLITDWFSMGKGEPETVLQEKLKNGLKDLDPELLKLTPAFRQLLSMPCADPQWERLSPQEKQEKIFDGISQFFLRLNRNAPIVIIADDIHWMDKTSEAFFHHLIGRMPDASLLLILLYRQEYEHAWGGNPIYNQIAIPPLTREESRRYIRAALNSRDVCTDIEELIFSRASGNPLFMEELCTTLIDDKTITLEEGGWQLHGDADITHVPDTLQGIIAGRMDRLGENTKTTMQMASVIGRTFGFRLLRALTGMGDAVKTYLGKLQSLEFISEKTLFPELEYIFKNIITQEVAYSSLLHNRRREIHGKIGQAIEQMYAHQLDAFYEILAFHYSKSGITDKAVHYLKASGDKAMGNYAVFEAFGFFGQALDLLDTQEEKADPERLKLLHALIAPMIILNFPPGSLKLLEQGAALSRKLQDEVSLIRFYSNTGYLNSARGRHDQGIQFSEKAFDRAVQINDITAMAQTSPDLCLANMSAGRFDRAIDVAELMIHAIDKADRKTDNFGGPAIVYSTFFTISGYCKALLGDFEAGRTDCHTGLAEAEKAGSLFTTCVCRFYTGHLHLARGDWEEATAVFAQCLQDMGDIKFTQLQAGAKAGLGLAMAFTGNAAKGKSLCREAITMLEKDDVRWGISNIQLYQGICIYMSDDRAAANPLFDKAIASAVENREPFFHARALIWSGRLAAGAGNRSNAETLILEGMEILEKLAVKPDMAVARFFLAETCLVSGQPEAAQEHLTRAESLFSSMGMLFWQQQAAKKMKLA